MAKNQKLANLVVTPNADGLTPRVNVLITAYLAAIVACVGLAVFVAPQVECWKASGAWLDGQCMKATPVSNPSEVRKFSEGRSSEAALL